MIQPKALWFLGVLLTVFGAIAPNAPAVAQTGAPEKRDITFGVLPITNYAVVYLAVKERFFEEQGLNVTPRMIGNVSPVAALVGGDFDIAGITWPAFLVAYNRGIPLVPVSEADRGTPGNANFLVKADSPYQKPADLLGKKVGVVTVGGVCDFILNDHLRSQNLDYKTISYTPIGVPDMAPTLLRGGIDAACVPEPLLTAVKAQGGVRPVMDLFTGEYKDWPLVGFPVTEKFSQTNTNTVAALKRALAKALKFAHDNPGKIRETFPTYTTLKPEQTARITLSFTPEKSDLTQVKRVAEVMDRLNVLPTKLKLPPSVEGR